MIVGIDPGMTGGVAMLSDTGEFLGGMRTPIVEHGKRKLLDANLVTLWLGQTRPTGMAGAHKRTVVEAPNSMPRQGLQSTFNFGRMCGAAEAWALNQAAPVELVTPAKWKTALKLGKDKQHSLDMCRLKFGPDKLWTVKANDGIAEAALIALWWLQA